jgi:hypothetical protein
MATCVIISFIIAANAGIANAELPYSKVCSEKEKKDPRNKRCYVNQGQDSGDEPEPIPSGKPNNKKKKQDEE